MSVQDQEKWDRKFAEGSHQGAEPAALLRQWLPRCPSGKALDVACGAGANAIYLAQAGYSVDAIDISTTGLRRAEKSAKEKGLLINWIQHDLERPYPFDTDYSLIIVFWYVDLPLLFRLSNCLSPGGHLICQKHMITDQTVAGPSNPEFRVKPGELRKTLSGHKIIHHSETITTGSNGNKVASAQAVVQVKPT